MIKFSVHAKDVNVMDATPDFMQSLFFNCPKLQIEMWDHPCMHVYGDWHLKSLSYPSHLISLLRPPIGGHEEEMRCRGALRE